MLGLLWNTFVHVVMYAYYGLKALSFVKICLKPGTTALKTSLFHPEINNTLTIVYIPTHKSLYITPMGFL